MGCVHSSSGRKGKEFDLPQKQEIVKEKVMSPDANETTYYIKQDDDEKKEASERSSVMDDSNEDIAEKNNSTSEIACPCPKCTQQSCETDVTFRGYRAGGYGYNRGIGGYSRGNYRVPA